MGPVAIVLTILVLAVVAFMSNRVPMGIVALGVALALWATGTLTLNQALAAEEVAAIEGEILPKMIVAGFSTVTITSVIVTSIIAAGIGR